MNPITVFLGKNHICETTKNSGYLGEKFDGNTMLLETAVNNYIYIGAYIYSFKTTNAIIKFYSPIGNNNVPYPYPYAIDSIGQFYLILEHTILKLIPDKHKIEPYEYFYNKNYIVTKRLDEDWNTTSYDGIIKFFIGNNQYALNYTSFPEEDYDRLIKDIGLPLYIITQDKLGNQKKKKINKKEYSELVIKFGHEQHWKSLDYNIVDPGSK